MNKAIVSIAVLSFFAASPAVALPVLAVDTAPGIPGVQPISTVDAGLVSIDVVVVGVEDLFAFQFELSFDPSMLSAVSVTAGSFLASGGLTFFGPGFIDNSTGTVSSVVGTLFGAVPGVDGSGVLASIAFNTIASPPIESTLTLSNTLLLDSLKLPIVHNVSGGRLGTIPEPPMAWMWLAGLTAVAWWRHRWRSWTKGTSLRADSYKRVQRRIIRPDA